MKTLIAKGNILLGKTKYIEGEKFEIEDEEVKRLIELGVADFATSEQEEDPGQEDPGKEDPEEDLEKESSKKEKNKSKKGDK